MIENFKRIDGMCVEGSTTPCEMQKIVLILMLVTIRHHRGPHWPIYVPCPFSRLHK